MLERENQTITWENITRNRQVRKIKDSEKKKVATKKDKGETISG